jgi:hypothetical protein
MGKSERERVRKQEITVRGRGEVRGEVRRMRVRARYHSPPFGVLTHPVRIANFMGRRLAPCPFSRGRELS